MHCCIIHGVCCEVLYSPSAVFNEMSGMRACMLSAFLDHECCLFVCLSICPVPNLTEKLTKRTPHPRLHHCPHAPQGAKGAADGFAALATLYHVLLTVAKVMSPFTPFITETMFQNLRKPLVAAAPSGAAAAVPESVHWCDMPQADQV
jgi:Anticodon-binding domain of tRNA ligase